MGKIEDERFLTSLITCLNDNEENNNIIEVIAQLDNRLSPQDKRILSRDIDAMDPWLTTKQLLKEEHFVNASSILGIKKDDVKKRLVEILEMYNVNLE
jgi:hypothetical protein